MITKIWLHEYGPFRQAELRLAPLTVLVGPNASGKTMAMEALLRVREAIAPPGGYQVLGDRLVPPAEVAQKFFQVWGRVAAAERSSITFETHELKFCFSTFSTLVDEPRPPVAGSEWMSPDDLPRIRLLKFEPQVLRSASYLDAKELAVQQDGYGLATVLADMKLQDDERLAWIEKQVSSIIPGFEGVKLRRAQVQRGSESVTGQELIFDMKNAHGLAPGAVSDGTILVLGIVTSIASATRSPQNNEPILILIDDLERGLHPRALSHFIGCLRRMTEEMSVQILATSHSPYLLDSLSPEEVRLTTFLDDGSAGISELADHPEFQRWKDVMTPGEFWSTAGEDWIRDVRR